MASGQDLSNESAAANTSVTFDFVSTPEVGGIGSLSADSENDIWAASVTDSAALHFNGSTWGEVPMAKASRVNKLAVLSPTSVWAVGQKLTTQFSPYWPLTVFRPPTPSGGARPSGIAFDGANLWIANSNSNNIAKIRTSDATLLGTFGTGLAPLCPVYDGTNVWVANRGSGTVTKLRASDGANQGTFSTGGSTPNHMVFDGDNIWVTNEFDDSFVKIRPSDGAQVF